MLIMRLLIVLTMFTLAGHAQPADTLFIWPDQVPGQEEEKHPPKSYTENQVLKYTGVTNPSLTVFEPDLDLHNDAGIIVCPGGGYRLLAMDLEGYEVARWLNELGFTAFVLQYRVPDKRKGAFQDLQRAIRMVRSSSDQWSLNPNKVGVLGFSAGGHLCASLGTGFNENTYPSTDSIDTLSSRPDFALLIYPAYLDKGPGKSLSPELTIDAVTPPMFLFSTADDKYGNSSLVMAGALRDHNIPVELHLLPEGGHGYGLRDGNPAAETWPGLAAGWLNRILQSSPPDRHNSRMGVKDLETTAGRGR